MKWMEAKMRIWAKTVRACSNLAALIDLQCDFLRIAKLQGGKLPTGFDCFSETVREMADETLAKWEVYAQPMV